MDKRQQNRLVFDVTTLAQLRGARTGIWVVVHQLALWACKNRDDVVFVVYNPNLDAFCTIQEQWQQALLEGRIDIEPSPQLAGQPLGYRLRSVYLKRVRIQLRSIRRRIAVALDRWQHGIPGRRAQAAFAYLQSLLLTKKLQREIWDETGRQRLALSHQHALGPAITFSDRDVLMVAGLAWTYGSPGQFGKIKKKHENRLVFVCHDIMPILFPDLFKKNTARRFKQFMDAILPTADLVVFNSQCSLRDTIRYCELNKITIGNTGVMRLGSRFVGAETSVQALPHGLVAGHYALYVSAFQERKGHAFILSVWQKLLSEGVPQSNNFKLVFAGSGTERALQSETAGGALYRDSVVVLSFVDDPQLAGLYRDAAFCVFPSRYEGFGLPVIECFSFGKALIASTGGALPEVVGDLSPCLHPDDERAWFDMLKLWIERPEMRAEYETAIRDRFHATLWDEAAEDFFRLVEKTEMVAPW